MRKLIVAAIAIACLGVLPSLASPVKERDWQEGKLIDISSEPYFVGTIQREKIRYVISDAPAATSSSQPAGQIIGNKRSKIYHLPNCPDYSRISEKNLEYFKTKEEAEKAGYRMARNCP